MFAYKMLSWWKWTILSGYKILWDFALSILSTHNQQSEARVYFPEVPSQYLSRALGYSPTTALVLFHF